MNTNDFNIEFAKFRQQLLVRPGRKRLGLDMAQEEAVALLADDEACRACFEDWQSQNEN